MHNLVYHLHAQAQKHFSSRWTLTAKLLFNTKLQLPDIKGFGVQMSCPTEKGWHLLFVVVLVRQFEISPVLANAPVRVVGTLLAHTLEWEKYIQNLFWRQEGLVGEGRTWKPWRCLFPGLALVSRMVHLILSLPSLCSTLHLPYLQDTPAAHSATSPDIETKFLAGENKFIWLFLAWICPSIVVWPPAHLRREGLYVFPLVTCTSPAMRHIKSNKKY